MNIDMAALHAIEVDRGIPAGELLETIKSALLTAYRHTAGHQADASIDIDRKTGEVKVIAREHDAEGRVISEWDDTPEGFGRVAATTARQVMLQRFRDAENEKIYGEFSAREGDIVAGVIQRDARANARGEVVLRMGSETKYSEGVIPASEQVPGRATSTATGCGASFSASRGACGSRRSGCRVRTRTWSANCSRWRSPRSPTARWTSSPSRGRPGTGRRSRWPPGCPGSTPRAPASVRWGSACAT